MCCLADDDLLKPENAQYKKLFYRDQKRWNKADSDRDNSLTKEEYAAFLHPEDRDHMKSLVVDVSSQCVWPGVLDFGSSSFSSYCLSAADCVVIYAGVGHLELAFTVGISMQCICFLSCGSFTHPVLAHSLSFPLLQETLEDIDTDKDGKISLAEYISKSHSSVFLALSVAVQRSKLHLTCRDITIYNTFFQPFFPSLCSLLCVLGLV